MVYNKLNFKTHGKESHMYVIKLEPGSRNIIWIFFCVNQTSIADSEKKHNFKFLFQFMLFMLFYCEIYCIQ